MPNLILPQDYDRQELFNAISSFFSRFKIGNQLRKCNDIVCPMIQEPARCGIWPALMSRKEYNYFL